MAGIVLPSLVCNDDDGPDPDDDQIWSAGVSPRTAPKDRKFSLLRHFWPVSGPGRPRNFLKTPQNPVNHGLRPQKAEPSNHRKCKMYEVAQRERGSDGPTNSRKLPGGTELRQKRRPARNIWFNPGSNPGPAGNIWFNPGPNPGPHPPWAGDRAKKPVNRKLPENLVNTTQRRQRVTRFR